ncbi:class A beta-lactamase [Methylobacterium iners]|uniref:beta-lactamase n=1 Tax=Methylobacterium iners TaxID=418707 RepID=A0ABQ4RXS7_9HYPH|nr:class A beta-lactamase [Methylobacterium iners]GJD95646.1 Beta-lactamase FAR-1 [Methylobacterium iners]
MVRGITRRTALAGTGALILSPVRAAGPEARFAALEQKADGRLGVAMLDTVSGRRIGYRAEERFALCSTFKLLAGAQALSRVDRGEDRLDAPITVTRQDLVTYSPMTETRLGTGLTIAEACDAAITLSDNTAANLLLDRQGGPAGLTAYLRSLGDAVTRLDRRETALNEATPSDPRDTTTPGAMLEMLRRLILGDVLTPASRAQLATWLVASKTGGRRLRAGLPEGWRIGDKTGTGSHGATNDVAVAWPPGQGPLLIAAYFAESSAPAEQREAVLAEVGRIAAELLGG